MKKLVRALQFGLLPLAMTVGCNSPFYTDKGALVGGLAGTGVGAVTGAAVGHPGVGALVGAGVGTLTGAAVGSGMDSIEARNRAQIAATLGRQVPPGNVTLPDVIAMTRAGVNDELIVNHIRANGLAQPLQSGDLITLQNSGVSTRVIGALQSAPQPGAPAMAAPGVGPPVPVPAYYPYPGPYWGPPPPYAYWGYGWRPPPPRVGWGVAVGGPL
ncbi:MAG TPA: glycine zipper domain-containing protein [Pirellulales bacterium]|jgi:hypothetical protein